MGLLQKLNPFSKSEGRMVEAVVGSIEAEEEGWRKLTGDSSRDLSSVKQGRMRKMAHYLWESNLLANRLIELPLAYMLAKGVKLTIKDEEAQTVLDRHWRDGINAWDIKLPKKVRELALFGEQCWPAFADPRSGFVRWGYLDPGLIETVVMDPDNSEQPIGVVTTKDKQGNARRYRVIVNVDETAFSDRTQRIRESFTDGQCLYHKVNDLCCSSRGRSDLLAQIDWLDAYDHFLFGEVDRADFMRAFIWDVMIKGATSDEIKEWEKKIGTPKPGSVRIHNEQIEWNAVSPDLKAADMSEASRLFRNHILGGATVPEHWYGGAADVNRSTGQSMAEPTEKVLEMRQTFVGYMLQQMATFVLRSYWAGLDRPLSEDEQTILDSLNVQWPEMSAKDTTRYAAALQQVVSAAAIALADGLIVKRTAVSLVESMARELGVEIDVDEELQMAEDELAMIREDDAFVPGLDVSADGAAKAQDTALNGAQVTAAQQIVTQVAAGSLPRESGVRMLVSFFNLSEDVAEAVMGEVGKSFSIDPDDAG